MWVPFLLALPFLFLGVYGGMCAISRWVRGYTGFFIFTLVGGIIYFGGLIVSAILFFAGMYALKGQDNSLVLLLFAMMPFAIFGHVICVFALAVEWFSKATGPSEMPVARTFDQGDGLMARSLFAEAEAQFRSDLQEEPRNTDAFLRVCRALEGAGRLEDAARELGVAHQRTFDRRDEPPLDEKARSERLLRLTYALGDLFLKLDRMEQARQLYRQTLEVLYGYRDADPLRDRLRALEEPGRLKLSDAVRKAQPDRLQI